MGQINVTMVIITIFVGAVMLLHTLYMVLMMHYIIGHKINIGGCSGTLYHFNKNMLLG
jgi:hypothetical protein